MIHFLGIGLKIPGFVINPLKAMLNHVVVDRLSLQKIEYEMERVDLPDDSNFFEIGYCCHIAFPYAHIQLEPSTKLILSHSQ